MSESVKDWLRTKGTILWANWDITDEKELDKAAEWFESELQSFEQFWMRNLVKHEVESIIYPDLWLACWPAPQPQDHESQMTRRGVIGQIGPAVVENPDDDESPCIYTDGLIAGGVEEYRRARSWAERQIDHLYDIEDTEGNT